MSRAFSVSEHISSTPGALPPGSFMTPSATSARVTDESSLPPSLHDDNQLCHFMYAVCLVFSSIYYLCHLLARHFARNARARRYTTQNVTCNKVLYVAYSRASVCLCVCCKRETDFCFVILKSICKSSKVSQICSFISKRWRLVGKKTLFRPLCRLWSPCDLRDTEVAQTEREREQWGRVDKMVQARVIDKETLKLSQAWTPSQWRKGQTDLIRSALRGNVLYMLKV